MLECGAITSNVIFGTRRWTGPQHVFFNGKGTIKSAAEVKSELAVGLLPVRLNSKRYY